MSNKTRKIRTNLALKSLKLIACRVHVERRLCECPLRAQYDSQHVEQIVNEAKSSNLIRIFVDMHSRRQYVQHVFNIYSRLKLGREFKTA